MANADPLAGPAVCDVVAAQLSTPVGAVHVAIAPLVHVGSRVMLAGHVVVADVLSLTVTFSLAVGVFPEASVAVWLTNVSPTGKRFKAGTPVRVTVTPGQL